MPRSVVLEVCSPAVGDSGAAEGSQFTATAAPASPLPGGSAVKAAPPSPSVSQPSTLLLAEPLPERSAVKAAPPLRPWPCVFFPSVVLEVSVGGGGSESCGQLRPEAAAHKAVQCKCQPRPQAAAHKVAPMVPGHCPSSSGRHQCSPGERNLHVFGPPTCVLGRPGRTEPLVFGPPTTAWGPGRTEPVPDCCLTCPKFLLLAVFLGPAAAQRGASSLVCLGWLTVGVVSPCVSQPSVLPGLASLCQTLRMRNT